MIQFNNSVEKRMYLYKLANRIRSLHRLNKLKLVSYSVNEDIMKFERIGDRICVWLVKSIKGKAGVESLFNIMYNRNPEEIDRLVEQMLFHLEYGINTYNPKDIGGFSEAEIQKIVSFLDR